MDMTSLPQNLPRTVDQLISELDKLNPAPIITGPTDPESIQTLVFAAGRRSIVDELARIRDRENNDTT